MEKIELVMVMAPMMGHLVPAIELAKIMLQKANCLSISFLMMNSTFDPEATAKIESLTASCKFDRLHFRHLPMPDISQWNIPHQGIYLHQLTEFHKSNVRETVSKIKGFAGIIVDMINTPMMDIADELSVPSYIFFTCSAACLGVMLHFQALEDQQTIKTLHLLQRETKLVIPSFTNEVPIGVLPIFTTSERVWSGRFLKHTRNYRRAKGIIINTFADFESQAIDTLSMKHSYGTTGVPTIYPVGLILNRSQIQAESTKGHLEVIYWLDDQPAKSVLFICFGSTGSFKLDQVKEIALGLEKSGYRFIWVLKRPSAIKIGFAGEVENHGALLPEGFLNRTASIGKVVSWVPQLAILSHPAVGGFVSHCGWNSTLESIWCGVPIATWPLVADEQLNAFQLVKELGIAVEISLDYNEANEHQPLVKAGQIEKGIREVMDGENEVRKRVKELSEKSRQAIKEGGSSHVTFENLIHTICSSLPKSGV
ncbi:anthocyanidin 3-O-glucosyltransferase 2 [Coffea arabica]|uniref:Glycosyltransferase n=1 Tax=Coffea arabica TaxID=13443 RepID=A0A6P6WX91_COFAR|nr:anthocyanidin 3-O-glucosyltransferase 2-like [Coffea arabica]